MKTDRFNQIGIDRLIKLKWLEKVSSLTLAGNSEKDIKNILQNDLLIELKSNNIEVRGSINKTITILMKVWVKKHVNQESIKYCGLNFLKLFPQQKHIAVHWGMVMATYPFWGAVSEQTGRLLILQDKVYAKQIQRRLKEMYGDRETVSRRVRYVIRSYIDWGIINETHEQGVYASGDKYLIKDPTLITWLIECSLHARKSGSGTLKELIQNPSIFPFHLHKISAEQIASISPRLEVVKHNIDNDLIMLKNK